MRMDRLKTALHYGLAGFLVLAAGASGLVWAEPPAGSPSSAYSDVDPFIGTGEDGHTFPGATVPFGMVQLSPDTQVRYFKQSYKWAAGYRHEDTSILGFSHTHFSVAGDALYGAPARIDGMPPLGRYFLHAQRIRLHSPSTGRDLVVESPLPPGLSEWMDLLERV